MRRSDKPAMPGIARALKRQGAHRPRRSRLQRQRPNVAVEVGTAVVEEHGEARGIGHHVRGVAAALALNEASTAC